MHIVLLCKVLSRFAKLCTVLWTFAKFVKFWNILYVLNIFVTVFCEKKHVMCVRFYIFLNVCIQVRNVHKLSSSIHFYYFCEVLLGFIWCMRFVQIFHSCRTYTQSVRVDHAHAVCNAFTVHSVLLYLSSFLEFIWIPNVNNLQTVLDLFWSSLYNLLHMNLYRVRSMW